MGTVDFAHLPNGTQEALMDYGRHNDAGNLNSTTDGQQVRYDVVNGHWLTLASFLAQHGGPRGGLEAGKIVKDMEDGKLPENGTPC